MKNQIHHYLITLKEQTGSFLLMVVYQILHQTLHFLVSIQIKGKNQTLVMLLSFMVGFRKN